MKKENILNGLARGKQFFDAICMLGSYILRVCLIITMVFFWFYFIINQEYLKISGLMIKIIILGLTFSVFGLFFKSLIFELYEYLYKKWSSNFIKEMKKTK